MVYYSRHLQDKATGFTLIELLVVIAILGLLSTIISVAMGNARLKARDARRMSDMKQIQTALELFYAEQNAYPAFASIQIGSANYACLNSGGFTTANCASPFLASVPTDPYANTYYVYSGGSSTYSVNFNLEGQVNGLHGAVVLTPSGIGQQ